MKKTLLSILALTIFSLSTQAQITHKTFGDGWVIPMNADTEVDVDEDGITDFYVNQYPDELGFTAIFAIGCFTSPDESAYTSFDSRELTLHEEGEMVQLNNNNFFDYIDDDRGSGYSLSGGLADGWIDKKDVYVGFAVVDNTKVRNGWMKVSIDITTNELTIKEWAYTAFEDTDTGGILVGDTGETTSVKNLDDIEDIAISPNPASNRVQLSFNYVGQENLSVVIQNSIGQEVYRNSFDTMIGNTNLNLETSQWTNGTYFIRFETETAIRTERLAIAR